MKNYQLKTIISILCFILCGFILCLSVVCIAEWDAISESIIGTIVSIAYFIIGLCAKKGSQEDREDYINQHKSIKEIYNKLSHLCKKHYWALDIDSLIPVFTNKKQILIWAADTAVACQVYIYDYDIKDKNPKLHNDLKLMIELSKNIIDNKKYL